MLEARRRDAFLLMAEDDADAAFILAGRLNRYAAFHCQQATEKLIKGILIHLGIEAGVEHRLEVLLGRLPGDHSWRSKLAEFDAYTPFGTTHRYPSPGARVPEPPEPEIIAKDAKRLKSLISGARKNPDSVSR